MKIVKKLLVQAALQGKKIKSGVKAGGREAA